METTTLNTETITLNNDIRVFYVKATSFPDGVKDAHAKLHALVPSLSSRKYFGLSRMENDVIVYMAAAEEINKGEAEKLNCPTLVLKKGKYSCITINDFMKNMPAFGKSFQTLLSSPHLDPEGYCVEWYFNDKDVKCMVRVTE